MTPSTTECTIVRNWRKRRFSAGHLLKTGRNILSWILISALCSSCCTQALWEATDPNETIEVSADEVTRDALIEDGFLFHHHGASDMFHIEKTAKQKARDYSLRIVATPVAISADALLSGAVFVGLGMVGANPTEADWSSFNM